MLKLRACIEVLGFGEFKFDSITCQVRCLSYIWPWPWNVNFAISLMANSLNSFRNLSMIAYIIEIQISKFI